MRRFLRSHFLAFLLAFSSSWALAGTLYLKPISPKFQEVKAPSKVRLMLKVVDRSGKARKGVPVYFSLELAPMMAESTYISRASDKSNARGWIYVDLYVPVPGTYQVGARNSQLVGSPVVFTVEARASSKPAPPPIDLPEKLPTLPLPDIEVLPGAEPEQPSLPKKEQSKKAKKNMQKKGSPKKKKPGIPTKNPASQGTLLKVRVSPTKLKTIIVNILDSPKLKIGSGGQGFVKIKGFDSYGNPCQQNVVFSIELDNLVTSQADAVPEQEGLQLRCAGGMAVLEVAPGKKAGQGIVKVSADGLSAENAFQILPGDVAHIRVDFKPDLPVAGKKIAITAFGVDQFGNVAEEPVWLKKIKGAGSLRGSIFYTETAGEVIFTATAGKVSEQIKLRILPGKASQVQLFLQGEPIAGSSALLIGKVLDRFGNPISGKEVRFKADSEAQIEDVHPETDPHGKAYARIAFPKKKGKLLLKAEASGIVAELPVQLRSGSGKILAIDEPLVLGVNERKTFSLTLSDAYGNPVDFEKLTVRSDLLNAPSLVAIREGKGRIVLSAGRKAGKGEVTFSSLKLHQKVAVIVHPGKPASLEFNLAPSEATAGENVVIKVLLRDAFGNRVADGTKVSVSVTDGSLQGESKLSLTTKGGEVRFVYTASTKAGKSKILVSAGSYQENLSIEVLPGDPTKIKLPENLEAIAGKPLLLPVKAFDSYGNEVKALPEFHIEGEGSVDHKGKFVAKRAGKRKITVSYGSLSESFLLEVLPAKPEKILAVLEEKEIEAGEIMHIKAKVLDAYGNGVGNVLLYCYVGENTEPIKKVTDTRGEAIFKVKAPTVTGEVPIKIFSPQLREESKAVQMFAASAVPDFLPALGKTLKVKVKPGEPAKILLKISPEVIFAGKDTARVEASVQDAYGNPVKEAFTFTFFLPKGALAEPDEDPQREGIQIRGVGHVKATYIPPRKAGNFQLEVRVGTISSKGLIRVSGGEIKKLFVFVDQEKVIADGKSTVKVKILGRDLFDNPATGKVKLKASAGGFLEDSGIFSETERTLVAGEAMALFQASTKAGQVLLTAISSSIKAQTVIEQIPGPLDRLVVTPASIVLKSGKTQKFRAEGFDAFENPVAVTPSWGLVGFGEINQLGLFKATKSGETTIIATTEGIASKATVTVVSSEPSVLSMQIEKKEVVPEEKVQLTFSVQDDYGNPVADVYVLVESIGEFWFPPHEVKTDREGEASLLVTAPKRAGTYRIKAQIKGVAPVFDVLRVMPGPPAILDLAAHPNKIFPGEKSRISVEVKDIYGNLVSDGTIVRFSTTFGTLANGKVFQEVETKGGIASTMLSVRNDFSKITVTAAAGHVPAVKTEITKGRLITEMLSPPPPEIETPTLREAKEEEEEETSLLISGKIIDQLTFKDVDIRDVLNIIAKKAGINIVVDEEVKDRISLQLSKIPAGAALQVILESQGLVYDQIGNTILVRKSEKASAQKPFTIVSLAAAQAADVAEIVQSVLPEIKASLDKRNNAIVLSGDPDIMVDAKRLISLLDRPYQRSGFAQKVFVLNYADAQGVADVLKDMGIGQKEGAKVTVYEPKGVVLKERGISPPGVMGGFFQTGATTPQGQLPQGQLPISNFSQTGSSLSGLASIATVGQLRDPQSAPKNVVIVYDTVDNVKRAEEIIAKLDQPAPQVLLDVRLEEVDTDALKELGIEWSENLPLQWSEQNAGALKPQSFTRSALSLNAVINLLKKREKARTISAPRLATVSGKTAQIFIGDTIFVKQQELVSGPNQSLITVDKFSPVNVGILLGILPMISDDDYISVNVFTSVTTPVFVDDPSAPPNISGRTADTFVRLKEGETMVIGGLITSEERERLSKVPLLAEAPVLGSFFRNRRKEKRETELLIFITPHIVRTGQ